MVKKTSTFCFFVLVFFMGKAQNNQLQYYIDNALQNSPLLKDIQNQLELNRYDSLLIRATTRTQVTGNSFNYYAPIIKGYGYDEAITNGANISALVGVNKQLNNKKNLTSQFENLQLNRFSSNNASRINELDLKRTVIAQYITAFGGLQQLNFNKDIIHLLSKEEVILKKLTQSNVYKQSDYLAFLVTMQHQQLLVKQVNIQYRYDLATLNYLCGLTDTSDVMLVQPALQYIPLVSVSQSPLFKQFEIDSLKLTNNKKLVDVNYRPKVNLFADAGYNSSLAYLPYKNFGTSFGLSLAVPIYDGKQKKLEYSKIDIAERTRKNYQAFFVNQYQQQIDQLNGQLAATEDLINDINNQLKYTQSLIDVNGKLLEAGEVRITDYILALNNYIYAKNLVTQNNITRLQIINQLKYWSR